MPRYLYDGARKWFTIGSSTLFFVLFVLDAPFGRFSSNWIFSLNGRLSWIIMEIVSPICFTYTYATSPLGGALSTRQNILAAAYYIHYLNRAIISPLMAPSRSRSDVIVLAAGIVFNIMNGSLLGAYLSSPEGHMFITQRSASAFAAGLLVWAAGFVGNIKHDMILMDIRRKSSGTGSAKKAEGEKEHYSIPQGLLFRWVSFPNYLCEWVEWLGFAVAASATPTLAFPTLASFLDAQASAFWPSLTPPWIFLLNEIVLMLPRAYRAQGWYRKTFGDSFPRERRIVIPFVL